jgi:hypothetical protein
MLLGFELFTVGKEEVGIFVCDVHFSWSRTRPVLKGNSAFLAVNCHIHLDKRNIFSGTTWTVLYDIGK